MSNIHHAHLLSGTFLTMEHLTDVYKYYDSADSFEYFTNKLLSNLSMKLLDKELYHDLEFVHDLDVDLLRNNGYTPININYLRVLEMVKENYEILKDRELNTDEYVYYINRLHISILHDIYLSGIVWSHNNICKVVASALDVEDVNRVIHYFDLWFDGNVFSNIPWQEAFIVIGGTSRKSDSVVELLNTVYNRGDMEGALIKFEKDLLSEMKDIASRKPEFYFKERCRLIVLLVDAGFIERDKSSGANKELTLYASKLLEFNDDYVLTKHFENFTYFPIREVS